MTSEVGGSRSDDKATEALLLLKTEAVALANYICSQLATPVADYIF